MVVQILHDRQSTEIIVFVWSQYDGGNIDKEQLAMVPSKTNDATQVNDYGRRLQLILTTC